MGSWTRWVRRRSAALVVVAVVVGALWQAGGLNARGLNGPKVVGELSLAPVVELRLHGSTPSVAWAADGRRLAVNAAFTVHDSDQLARRHRAKQGVHVLDITTGQTLQVPFVGARHPFWLDGDTLGWVNNYYVGERPGLFLASAHLGAKVRRLDKVECAHRAHLARNGGILAYVAGDTYGWAFVDPRSGKSRSAFPEGGRAGDPPGSWDTPRELIVDQCPSRLGTTAVAASAAGGVEVKLGNSVYRLAGEKAYVFEHDYAPEGGAGPVQPCLSPDGRHMAYLAAGGAQSQYVLKVVRVPDPAQAQRLARPVGSGPDSGSTGSLARLEPAFKMRLHGTTPSLAWSPDSRRVVANAAFEYYGHDSKIRSLRGKLGIWILDALSGQTTHVFAGQGYHPFWLSSGKVGWGHSRYEEGPPGIYLAAAVPKAKPRRIGHLKGVHRTLLAKDGGVLAYVGFPEYHRWVVVDPHRGMFEKLPALAEVGSWDDPAGHYQDQCLQKTPGAELVRNDRLGFSLRVGAKAYALGGDSLLTYSGDAGSGPVQACLSPDGSKVAFLAGGEVRIASVPY